MTALAKDRNAKAKHLGRSISLKVAASTTIYAGSLVCVNTSGYAVPAAKTAGFRVVGVAAEKADNSGGSNGDIRVLVEKGVFAFVNDGDAVAQADVGRPCWVVDDQTVADENDGSGILAGLVDAIDEDGTIYVAIGDHAFPDQGSGIETVTSGALSVHVRHSRVSVTGTQAYTLPAGLYEGQIKTLRVVVAASTPDGTLTPATFADGTSIDLDAVDESVILEWHDATGWNVVAIVGATINA